MVTLSSPVSQEELEKRISLAFPLVAHYPDIDFPIHYRKIALCPGSGKSLLERVIKEKPQAFLSGDLSHHDIARLNLWGITYYSIPHEEGERKALKEIYKYLKEEVAKQGLKVELNFETEEKRNE